MIKKNGVLVGELSGKKISPTLLKRLGLDESAINDSSELSKVYEDYSKDEDHSVAEQQLELDYDIDSESMNNEVSYDPIDLGCEDYSEDEYRDVNIHDLVPNDENKSIYLEIEDQPSFNKLKQSIKEIGLIEPIVCQSADKNNKYVIISGHRRHSALLELFKEGHKQFKTIEVKVANGTKKEDVLQTILDANNSTREISEYSKMISVMKYAEVYQGKKKRKEIPVGLTEKKFVSDRMNIGERQIAKYLYMYKRIEPSILQEVINNNEFSLNQLYNRMDELKKQKIDIKELTIDDFLNSEKPNDNDSKAIIETDISIKTKNKMKRFSKDLCKVYDVGKGITQTKDLDNKTKKHVNNLLKRIENTLNEFQTLLESDQNVDPIE